MKAGPIGGYSGSRESCNLFGPTDTFHQIFKGRIQRKLSEDIRGIRYRIEGPAKDGRLIHMVCRFKEEGYLIVVTVYALTEDV
jgi:hypothetical protein